MASKFLERLAEGPILGDGGYILELERRCLGSRVKGISMAVLDYPEGVLELHREFARAGAEVLQAMAWGVREFDRMEELHHTAVKLAREAAGPAKFVAGTVNKFGLANYQRRSPFTEEERTKAQKFFEKRVGQQAAAGVDLFILESFYAVEEAELAIPFVKETGLPAVVTLTFKSGRFTSDRYPAGEAAKRLVGYGADLVGVNCGRPWLGYRPIVEEMMGAVSVPICTQPFTYELEPGEEYARTTSGGASVHVELRYQPRRAMADYARNAWDMGVKLIGSCCGSLPYHVRAMAEAIGKPTELPDVPNRYRLQ